MFQFGVLVKMCTYIDYTRATYLIAGSENCAATLLIDVGDFFYKVASWRGQCNDVGTRTAK